MNENKKKSKGLQILCVVLFFVVCLVLGIGLGIYAVEHEMSLNFSSLIIALIVMYLNLFVQINIHEFGHFIFGKLFGYQLISYRIGCFSWDYENGKLKFSIKNNKGYGGLCAMLPRGDIKKSHYAFFIAGGVLLNTISLILFVVLFVTYQHTNSVPLLGSLAACIFITLILVISNALPVTMGPIQTDGKIFFSLWHQFEESDLILDMFQVMTQLSGGIRPRDLVFKTVLRDEYKTLSGFEVQRVLYSYFQALDSSHTESMKTIIEIIERNLVAISSVIMPAVKYELIYYYLVVDKDLDKAKRYYDDVCKQIVQDQDINGCRINAVCALYLDKDEDKVKDWIEKGLSVANKYPLKGQALLEVSLLNKLKQEIL